MVSPRQFAVVCYPFLLKLMKPSSLTSNSPSKHFSHDEYRAARADVRANKASFADISARRLQVADTTARASFRHLSMSVNEDVESDVREAARVHISDDEHEAKLIESQSVEMS